MAISILITLITGLIFSLGMLNLIINICKLYGVVDTPNWRKVHHIAVPRLGGLIFVPSLAVSMAVGMGLMDFYGILHYEFGLSTFVMVAGAIIMYMLGLADDLQEMRAGTKFLIQIIASLLFPLCNLMITNLQGFCGIYEMPLWLSYPFTVFVILLIVNAINLIDGIDGLSSGLALLMMAVLSVLFYHRGMYLFTIIGVSMIATLLIFFLYNFFGRVGGRKIFMGDAGSLTLGYIISYLVIKFQMPGGEQLEPLPSTLLVVSYSLVLIPVFDVARVAMTRVMKGRPMFAPDKTHIHHKLMRTGHYMHMALFLILQLAILFFVMNICLDLAGVNITFIVLADVLLYSLINLYINRRIRRYEQSACNFDELRQRFEAHARTARKICILTPRFPVPENGGDVLRINNIARQLRAQGYELILVSLEEDGAPQIYEAQRIYHKVYTVHRSRVGSLIHALLAIFRAQPMQCGYYASAAFSRKLDEVIEREQPDLFIAHLLRMMPYLDTLGLHDRSVIEMTDALSKTYSMSGQGKGNALLRYIYNMEQKLILRAEQYALMHFPKNVLVSASDIDYLRQHSLHPESMELHANGIQCMPTISANYNPHKIVFVGNMRTLQNQDAVIRFVERIFPKILQQCPNAHFYIVGALPPRCIQQLACDNITVTGFVDDLESTISDACLAVAPVHVAAGIQNKVLVSMACGLPVVLTPLIAKAIPELRHEENCLIQDGSSAFAEDCLRIMRHPELRAQLAAGGYQVVRENYSWDQKIQGYII